MCRQPSAAHQPEQCIQEPCMDRLVELGNTPLTGGSASGRGRGEDSGGRGRGSRGGEKEIPLAHSDYLIIKSYRIHPS